MWKWRKGRGHPPRPRHMQSCPGHVYACLRIAQIRYSAAVTPEAVSDAPGSRDRFSTTRWSMILACADSAGSEEKAHKALADLCKMYWRPIFAFVCRRGYSVPDAQDLTQDFFLMVLEGDI